MALRMKIRTGFRLQVKNKNKKNLFIYIKILSFKGSILKDWLAAICCPCCLLLQINSELEHQGL
jgi:hypothetical protein